MYNLAFEEIMNVDNYKIMNVECGLPFDNLFHDLEASEEKCKFEFIRQTT